MVDGVASQPPFKPRQLLLHLTRSWYASNHHNATFQVHLNTLCYIYEKFVLCEMQNLRHGMFQITCLPKS